MQISSPVKGRHLRAVGLFSGIGGIERGLERSGHSTVLLVENDESAQSVLQSQFPTIPVWGDIRDLHKLPDCDLVAAGFPCQNLSQCGNTAGIEGSESSLVNDVFRLVEGMVRRPNWLVLENVPFMLRLQGGRAMTLITSELRRLGYRWAYRTVNARAFGVPQRRLRVVVVASRDDDPRQVLFADEAIEQEECRSASGFGFYWTEGNTGLGWGRDCVPTLKGGSTVGIPSPPAIWIPAERRLATIDIRDAERLQGFPADWTKSVRNRLRWRLVGNAVCVRVAAWIGRRLGLPKECCCEIGDTIRANDWPSAAYGDDNGAVEMIASTWPVAWQQKPILDFLRFPLSPLSARATAGFLLRAKNSRLRFDPQFIADVEYYLNVSAPTVDKRTRPRQMMS